MKVRFKTYEEMKFLEEKDSYGSCYSWDNFKENMSEFSSKLGKYVVNKEYLKQIKNNLKRTINDLRSDKNNTYAFSIYRKLRVGETPRYAREKTNYYPVYFGMLIIEEEYEDIISEYSVNEINNIKNLLKEINYEL